MALIEGLNYVESNILNELLEIPTPNNTRNATLVIGTARKGRNSVLTKVTKRDANTLFGNVPTGSDFETNISHAVNAILSSTANQDKEIYAYKIGNAKKARLDLYENQVFVSGDNSYSFDEDGNPIIALSFEARQESEEDNITSAIVTGDNSGLPTSLTVSFPNGATNVIARFALDPYSSKPNTIGNVRDLVTRINQNTDISEKYNVTYNTLRKTNLSASVQTEVGGRTFIDVSPVGLAESWGDKLEAIERVTQIVNQTDTIPLGSAIAKLTYRPDKDTDENTVTIQTFTRVVKNELIKLVTTSGVTNLSEQLNLSESPSYAWNGIDLSVIISEVRRRRGAEVLILDPSDYSFAAGLLTATIPPSSPNDRFEIDYEYIANLEEANVRSELVLGSDNSYFVFGDRIVFGAAPSFITKVTYQAIKEFQGNDLNIVSRQNITIDFIDSSNAPADGDTVYLTFTYLPELPAITGSSILDNTSTPYTVQRPNLGGGTAGSLITKQDYKAFVEEALDETMLVPFRRVIVAGAFLDDTVEGIDEETGLPGTVALNWGDLLFRKLDFKSRVAQECHTVIGVKPIDPVLLSKGEKGINEWSRYLLDDLDNAHSAASMISSLDDYHIDVALGVALVSDSSILNGTSYVENPAYIITGMQLDNSLEQSLIRAQVPPFVKDLLVRFPSGTIVGRLNSARYTTLAVNPRGEFRIMDAPAATDQRRNVARQLVRDTVFATLIIARDIAESFIGLRRDQTHLNLMKDKVNRGVIDSMIKNARLLTFFSAEIIPVLGGHITGDTKMRILIETAREISRIELETTVKLAGANI